MKLEISTYKYWKLKEWRCCGHLWQLLVSKKYPERNKWRPLCTSCGEKGPIGRKSDDYAPKQAANAHKKHFNRRKAPRSTSKSLFLGKKQVKITKNGSKISVLSRFWLYFGPENDLFSTI